MKLFVVACIFLCLFSKTEAQEKKVLIDSAQDRNRLKTFNDFIKPGAICNFGLLTSYKVGEKYYLEISDTILNKELLAVSRIAKGAYNTELYAGDEISNMIVVFEKLSANKIVLRKRLYNIYNGDSTSSLYQAVARSASMPILASFNIEALGKDKNSSIINITDFAIGDSEPFSFSKSKKASLRLGGLALDKSFLNGITNYPANIEVLTTKTYSTALASANDPTSSDNQSTIEINTSIIRLPDQLMEPRFSDSRIGYFSFQQIDFDANPNGIKERSYIRRWRIEPKPEDVESYKRGKLVDPKTPIVFYIDPATPKKWVPYLIQGVNDWQIAFEQAGFKNAIIAKVAPDKSEDSLWSLYDARHSVIVYKPSEIENASGPTIADPRTGEILESHINWYHNVIRLAHNWYMVQCGVVDTTARHMLFPDTLMGKLIRGIISHEVGHTLGLMHNFSASSTVPVSSLRDKVWVEKNGFCPSIMDYARFNYVAQAEDKITQSGLLPRIGSFDKFAIEWGYRLYPNLAYPDEEKKYLNTLLVETSKESKYSYNPPGLDPRIQAEDLGDNALLADSYGIRNLKKIVPNLIKWTYEQNDMYGNLNDIYNEVIKTFGQYMAHPINYIIGNYQTLKTANQSGPIYEPIPKALSKQAMNYLNDNFFKTPIWLIDSAILNRTGQTAIGIIDELQDDFFSKLLFKRNLLNIASRNETNYDSNMSISLFELMEDLRKMIWSEIYTPGKTIDVYRRNLQRNYLHYVLAAFSTTPGGRARRAHIIMPVSGVTNITNHDVEEVLTGHVKQLKKDIIHALEYCKDRRTGYHLDYVIDQINTALKGKLGSE